MKSLMSSTSAYNALTYVACVKRKFRTNFMQIINYKIKKTFLQSYTAFDNTYLRLK